MWPSNIQSCVRKDPSLNIKNSEVSLSSSVMGALYTQSAQRAAAYYVIPRPSGAVSYTVAPSLISQCTLCL